VNDIVLVSSVGDFWITGEVARKVATSMQKGTAHITINGNMIACNSIRGLLQPAQYKTNAVNSRRNWVCKRGTGHAFNDVCNCKDPIKADLTKPALEKSNPLTPEQQAEKDRRSRANLAWMRANKGNFKRLANKAERDKFIAEYDDEKTMEKPLIS